MTVICTVAVLHNSLPGDHVLNCFTASNTTEESAFHNVITEGDFREGILQYSDYWSDFSDFSDQEIDVFNAWTRGDGDEDLAMQVLTSKGFTIRKFFNTL